MPLPKHWILWLLLAACLVNNWAAEATFPLGSAALIVFVATQSLRVVQGLYLAAFVIAGGQRKLARLWIALLLLALINLPTVFQTSFETPRGVEVFDLPANLPARLIPYYHNPALWFGVRLAAVWQAFFGALIIFNFRANFAEIVARDLTPVEDRPPRYPLSLLFALTACVAVECGLGRMLMQLGPIGVQDVLGILLLLSFFGMFLAVVSARSIDQTAAAPLLQPYLGGFPTLRRLRVSRKTKS